MLFSVSFELNLNYFSVDLEETAAIRIPELQKKITREPIFTTSHSARQRRPPTAAYPHPVLPGDANSHFRARWESERDSRCDSRVQLRRKSHVNWPRLVGLLLVLLLLLLVLVIAQWRPSDYQPPARSRPRERRGRFGVVATSWCSKGKF